jgi:hypothetical protein
VELAGHTRFGGYKNREATYQRGATESNVVVMGLSKPWTVGKAVDVKVGKFSCGGEVRQGVPRGGAETFPDLPAPQHSQKRSLSASKFTVCKVLGAALSSRLAESITIIKHSEADFR